MTKKILMLLLSITLVFALALSITSCRFDSDDDDDDDDEDYGDYDDDYDEDDEGTAIPTCPPHKDSDDDNYCDKCGKALGGTSSDDYDDDDIGCNHYDYNGDGYCDNCYSFIEPSHECYDYNGNSYCDACGNYYSGNNGDYGHTHEYGEWQTTMSATCIEDGIEIRYCYYCNYFDQRAIPASDEWHNFDYTYGYCIYCGEYAETEFSYRYNDDGTYTVDGVFFTVPGGELKIPAYYNNCPVTAISSSAFQFNEDIKTVTIPNTITSIGDYAFYNCTALEEVYISSSVKTIGSYAFQNCTSLSSLYLPEGVEKIGNYAFASCYDLTSVSLPESIRSIGGEVFYACSSLTYTYDGYGMYLGNYSNPYLVLMRTTYPDISYYTINGNTRVIAGHAFEGCEYLESITIPNYVVAIGPYAFSECYALTEVSFGENLLFIDECAFNATALQYAYFNSNTYYNWTYYDPYNQNSYNLSEYEIKKPETMARWLTNSPDYVYIRYVY